MATKINLWYHPCGLFIEHEPHAYRDDVGHSCECDGQASYAPKHVKNAPAPKYVKGGVVPKYVKKYSGINESAVIIDEVDYGQVVEEKSWSGRRMWRGRPSEAHSIDIEIGNEAALKWLGSEKKRLDEIFGVNDD